MAERLSLSDDLTNREWTGALEALGRRTGFARRLGTGHMAVFADGTADALLVSFESQAGIRATAENGLPIGFDIAQRRGWAHLSLVATTGDPWFRDPAIWAFFDEQTDEDLFDGYSTVVFQGAGPAGYAAAAYSVAAPGAIVVAIAPQATLAPSVAGWDDRFTEMRRLDFTTRYGFAPDMIDAAASAWIVVDPGEPLDAMHAALFTKPHVRQVRYRRGSAAALEADLRAMGVLDEVLDDAAAGKLDLLSFHGPLRARHRHTPYLRALLSRVMAKDRPFLTALLCRAVLFRQPVPRFRRYYVDARQRLEAMGQSLPPPREAAQTGEPPAEERTGGERTAE